MTETRMTGVFVLTVNQIEGLWKVRLIISNKSILFLNVEKTNKNSLYIRIRYI